MKQAGKYLTDLRVLAEGVRVPCQAPLFAWISLLGLVVDLVIFQVLLGQGMRFSTAHVVSFAVAASVNYALNSRWAFSPTAELHPSRDKYTKFLALFLLALFLRGGALTFFKGYFHWPVQAALIAAAGLTAVVNYLGLAYFVLPQRTEKMSRAYWQIAALGLIAYSVLLRLVYLGLPSLLPEEAYYFNYAQHPAMGYLDHPPMVAWLIKAGTVIFRHSEFGVRSFILIFWAITAGFCFGLARNLFDKKTALQAVLLFSLLPLFFFQAGLFMFPDVPLFAAWAGALFFLERALLAERRMAWWGVGICFGLGMLSKYSIALLALPTVLFVLLDGRSRRWLLRPEPYVAVVLAFLIFTPVILWNAENKWVSFLFQSGRRLDEKMRFSLHALIGCVILALTPLGAVCAARSMLNKRMWESGTGASGAAARKWLFSLVFTLAPLAVFAFLSLKHEHKLNWVSPVLLAVLPALARISLPDENFVRSRSEILWQRSLMPMLLALAIVYGGMLHYASIGLPGVPYAQNVKRAGAWEELGRKVEEIENMIERETGEEPLVVGIDKNVLASELAFYRGFSKEGPAEGSGATASANLFQGHGLMYEWWFPWQGQVNKTCLIIGLKPAGLSDDQLSRYFASLTPVQKACVTKNDLPAGCFFYRVGKGYIGKK